MMISYGKEAYYTADWWRLQAKVLRDAHWVCNDCDDQLSDALN